MKTTFFIVLLGVFSSVNAQSDTAVEIKLALLRETNAQGQPELALTVSIANLLDKDVYIPNFEQFAKIQGIHYYQKEGTKWREIDIFSQNYYYPYQRADPAHGIYESNPPMYILENDITKRLAQNVKMLQGSQQSYLHSIIAGKMTGGRQYPPTHLPIFLKARQVLSGYAVYDLDWLFSKHMDYKISIGSEERDKKYRMLDTVIMTTPPIVFPGELFGFERFFGDKYRSNTIFFSTIQ